MNSTCGCYEQCKDVCIDSSSVCYGKCSNKCANGVEYTKTLRSWIDDGCRGSADKIHKKYMLHCKDHHGYTGFDGKKHSGNGAPSGAFAFTLTKSPTDDLTEADMVAAVRKIMCQKSCPVKRYAWYLEYKEDGKHPHIHGMYETDKGGVIEKKHFSRAWKIWDPSKPLGAGFRGGYHRPVRSEEGYSDYIKKDGGLSEYSNVIV